MNKNTLIKSVGYLLFKDVNNVHKFLLTRRKDKPFDPNKIPPKITNMKEEAEGRTKILLKPVGGTYIAGYKNQYLGFETKEFEEELKYILEEIKDIYGNDYFKANHIESILIQSRKFKTEQERLVFVSFITNTGICPLKIEKIELVERIKNPNEDGDIEMNAYYVLSFTNKTLDYTDVFARGYAWDNKFGSEKNRHPEAHHLSKVMYNLFSGKEDFYVRAGLLAYEKYLEQLSVDEISRLRRAHERIYKISKEKNQIFERLQKQEDHN